MKIGLKAKNAAKLKQVIADRQIGPESLRVLIQTYTDKKFPGDSWSAQIAAGNIRKEFAYDQMSVNYLIKALGIIGLTNPEIDAVLQA